MNKEEELLAKRIQELARAAELKYCVTFSDFLNLNEQNILHQTLRKCPWIHAETFGGYEGAERQIAAFVPDALSYSSPEEAGWQEEMDYPIACIRIAPLNVKFAETLSHRDVLGALMHQGIDRSKMGDIAVEKEQFYLFCKRELAQTICSGVTRIRHTSVSCGICSLEDFHYEPERKQITGSVASVRLDAVMAVAFQSSRSSLLRLIEDGKVFVNGRLVTTNAYVLRDGDLVSARGEGKFRFAGTMGQTKKGRCMVAVEKFV